MASNAVQPEKTSRFSTPRFHAPKLSMQSLGLTTYVDYSKYNPNHDQSSHGRQSLAGLDYSSLRRITWASFTMGVLVSMGGFIFGYDTYECRVFTSTVANII